MKDAFALVDKLAAQHTLTREEFLSLFSLRDETSDAYLFEKARAIRTAYYGNEVFVRGLIEFTNFCQNDCYYCGIRKSNHKAERYRLTATQILECCALGYELGYRTFVLQGGEDPYFTDERLVSLVCQIRQDFPDCAITLSLGERSRESYNRLREAGANRYLLRHETANDTHYGRLHPSGMTIAHRKQCLWTLKELGFTVGAGFMVGSPYQTPEALAEDLQFIHELQPGMVGIGPFIPHVDTPFRDMPAGSVPLTLFFIGVLRLMLPSALLPATTALGTADPTGREKGILAGGNVMMPNLSPQDVREKYKLYNNKICTGDEAAECRNCLSGRMHRIGYEIVTDRGDPRTCPTTNPNKKGFHT